MARGKILAVDDEKFFRNLYSEILSDEGYKVVTAESGEGALELFAREPFDIVITDMAMKGMDGLETMEAIKKMNPNQDIIVVTGISDVQMAVNAMKKGVTDYVLKPINPDDFLYLIRTILEKQNLVAEHSKLIAENLEYFGILSVYRRCLRILSILDMERLLDTILDSIMAETNSQGSVLWLFSPEDNNVLKLATVRGVVNISAEADTVYLSTHGQLRMIKAGKPFYDTADGEKGVNENVFYVPLKLEQDTIGLIKVSDRLDRDRFEIRDLMIAKTIAGFAAIALDNALKVKEMEYKGFKDLETNTYYIHYFTDYVLKEINKANRYQRTFSILYIKIENYRDLRGEFKDNVLNASMQRVINAVIEVIRDADILARANYDEFYVLLPETDYFGSLMSIRRINKAIKGKAIVSDLKKAVPIKIWIRSVSVPNDGSELRLLLSVAKKRVEEAKKSLYTRYNLDDIDFWRIFDTLVGSEGDYPLGLIEGKASIKEERKGFEDEEGVGKFVLLTPQMLSRIHEVIFGEIEMNPDTRGILYLGAKDIEQFLGLLRKHPKTGGSATKIFLLGEREGKGWDMPAVTPVSVAKDEMNKAQFLLFLSVDYAYAIFLRERMDGIYYGIHTSDPIFVESMIAKLQENYHLQVQL